MRTSPSAPTARADSWVVLVEVYASETPQRMVVSMVSDENDLKEYSATYLSNQSGNTPT